ncbi:MAG TPA: ABC transporter permease [Candidatus Saccharimonadales bacterium]|nr:ABC transporter permease [Candidatus Saccharimonadales bacterium]
MPPVASASSEDTDPPFAPSLPAPRGLLSRAGRGSVAFLLAIQGLGAFGLISLGVMVTKFRTARSVMLPLALQQVMRSGVRLLPLATFLAVALGFIVIGQSVSVLNRVGAQDLLGTIMVTVVVRELGPLLSAILVLCRAGTATVVELGTARALGEVEALEVLGIDPIHYFVVPRLVGMAAAMFSLTVYLILGALLSGYLWAFLQDVPLLPGDYFRQLAGALSGLDFVLLAAKTVGLGSVIALVSCFHGLAQPLSIAEVSRATVRAVGQTIVLCAMLEALFILIYLLA